MSDSMFRVRVTSLGESKTQVKHLQWQVCSIKSIQLFSHSYYVAATIYLLFRQQLRSRGQQLRSRGQQLQSRGQQPPSRGQQPPSWGQQRQLTVSHHLARASMLTTVSKHSNHLGHLFRLGWPCTDANIHSLTLDRHFAIVSHEAHSDLRCYESYVGQVELCNVTLYHVNYLSQCDDHILRRHDININKNKTHFLCCPCSALIVTSHDSWLMTELRQFAVLHHRSNSIIEFCRRILSSNSVVDSCHRFLSSSRRDDEATFCHIKTYLWRLLSGGATN